MGFGAVHSNQFDEERYSKPQIARVDVGMYLWAHVTVMKPSERLQRYQ